MTTNYRSHVGLHYRDENGRKQCTVCLLNTKGEAVATADFENCKLTFFMAADSVMATAKEWLAGLIAAPVSEMIP